MRRNVQTSYETTSSGTAPAISNLKGPFDAAGRLARMGAAILVAVLSILGAGAVVSAQSPEGEGSEYQQTIREAVGEYRAGRFDEARVLFEKAHAIEPNARTLRGIGLAAYEARHYVQAIEALEAALQSRQRPLTDEQRERIGSWLARARTFVASIKVRLLPPEAQLTVDGQEARFDDEGGLLLDAGDHELVATLTGYQSVTRRVVAAGGKRSRITIELQPLSGSESEGSTGFESGAGQAGGRLGSSPDRVETSDSGDGSIYRTLGWVGVASAGVSLVGSAICFGVSEIKVNEWNGPCNQDGTRELTCPQHRDAITTLRTAGIVTLSTGVALGITSLVLFLVAPDDDASDDDASTEHSRIDLTGVPGGYTLRYTVSL